MAAIDTLLKQMLDEGGSDLHLATGMPPKVRSSGSIGVLKGQPVITPAAMERYLREIASAERWEHYLTNHDLDLAYEIPGLARFRGNFLYNQWGMGAVFRQIPAKILSFDTLKLPEVLKKVCAFREGLVLVTGPTGSGKSTTLAAMIDYINDNYEKHIITIEDPIEFVHPKKKCVILHREVGEHSRSWAKALRGAMRADPDIILVGEMRDMETIRLALSCASMGMLVFGTLHTNSAPKTIDRIIDAFPADEQPQIRVMLSSCLACVVSQLLCKRLPKGRVAAHEILLQHEALPNTIRTGNIANVRGIIENGASDGMTLMDNSLRKLLEAGTISGEEAYMKSTDKEAFEQYLPVGAAGH